MEKLKLLVEEANNTFKKADHLAYITYPVVKETKLLYIIVENLYAALMKGVEAVLCYERYYKRIPPTIGGFNTELELFKDECIKRYNINRDCILLMTDLKKIIEARKRSPMEFTKNDKFVICSEDYKLKTLDIQKVKAYVDGTRTFIEKVNRIIRV